MQKLENLRLDVCEVVQEVQGDALPMMAKQIYGFRAATHSTFDPEFESKCQEYYQTTACMILGQLFPMCLQNWGKDFIMVPIISCPWVSTSTRRAWRRKEKTWAS